MFIDEKFCLINDLPLDDRRYGDLIWWANIEILIFPNFFNFKPLKGMHGYRNDDASTYGTCIFYANNFKPKKFDKIELSKIHDIILKVFSKMNKPEISVIICCYNGKTIFKCLESI